MAGEHDSTEKSRFRVLFVQILVRQGLSHYSIDCNQQHLGKGDSHLSAHFLKLLLQKVVVQPSDPCWRSHGLFFFSVNAVGKVGSVAAVV